MTVISIILGLLFLGAILLPIDTEMPESIYELMNLFPRRAQQYPSVQYVPDSERNEEDKSRGSTSDRMVTY